MKRRSRGRLIKIGRNLVKNALGFFYDGCHKIYVAETQADKDEFAAHGYVALLPMEELEQTFKDSCPLRFISWCDLDRGSIVPQCARRVTFEYDTHKSIVNIRGIGMNDGIKGVDEGAARTGAAGHVRAHDSRLQGAGLRPSGRGLVRTQGTAQESRHRGGVVTDPVAKRYRDIGMDRERFVDLVREELEYGVARDYSGYMAEAISDKVAEQLLEDADKDAWSVGDVRLETGRVICQFMGVEY